jgi:ABC-type sugar transport system ATPase subunit
VLNTLDGEIVTTADGASVRTPVALFPLADTGAASRPIRIGIRPEWLRLSTHPLPEAKALEVTLIEPLGAEILVHARWSSGELFARAPADFAAPEHGQVWIDAQASQVDLFDSDGRRVTTSRA